MGCRGMNARVPRGYACMDVCIECEGGDIDGELSVRMYVDW